MRSFLYSLILLLLFPLFVACEKEETGPPQLSDQFFEIAENSPNGTLVAVLDVINPNENSGITFTVISGNTEDAFAFDSTTGELIVSNHMALDFETNPSFEIIVEVSNKAKSIDVLISITLIDINDAPIINNQTFDIEEYSANGTIVGTLVISDDDLDQHSFEIISGNPNGIFGLTSEGNIVVLDHCQLDYNLLSTSTFVVEISDEEHSVSAEITIDIIDLETGRPIPTDGLVAYYPFNGNANDESTSGNHGTVVGATLVADRHGNANSAYSFDGVNDYILVNDHESLNPSEMTISVWYKTVSFDGGNWPVLTKGYTSHVSPYYQYHIGITGDGNISPAKFGGFFGVNNTYSGVVTNTNYWQVGNWYHLIATFDKDYIRLYINGELYDELYSPGDLVSYNQNLYIGKLFNNGKHLPGIIDDIRLYNRAIPSCEVMALYQE